MSNEASSDFKAASYTLDLISRTFIASFLDEDKSWGTCLS